MNRLRTLMVLSALIIISHDSHGQTVTYDQALGLPTVTPPSPDAAAIEKFGNIPVSYSTGVPDISVPIWTVQCETMKWPFSLSYHAAGIHVDELASGAGLGWALNGPGVISRAVQGLPDQLPPSTMNYDTITYSDWQFLYSALAGHQDIQPDIFSYNFNGHSGKFVVNPNGTILQIPYTDLRIVMNGGYASFSITDENGVNYTFDQQESTSTSNAQSGKNELYVSSWYLSKVMMPDQKDSVTFQYALGGESTQFFTNFSEAVGQYYPSDPILVTLYGPMNLSQTEVQTGILKLTQVNFPNGSININYATGYRTDIPEANNQIANISINRQAGGVTTSTKNWAFYQSYFFYQPSGTTLTYNDYRLRLDSLYEYGNDPSLAPEVYQFSYNPTPMVPNGNYGQDLWGFNNGHYNNASLLQSTWVYQLDGNNFSVGNANRNPDTVQMQACMLTSIRYPTGGKTNFTYQSNYFPGSPSTTSFYPITETCDAYVDENYSGRTGFRYPQGAGGRNCLYIFPRSIIICETPPLLHWSTLRRAPPFTATTRQARLRLYQRLFPQLQ